MLKTKSIPETVAYYFYVLLAIAPIYSMLVEKAIGKGIGPAFLFPTLLTFILLWYQRGVLRVPKYVWFYGLFVLYTIVSDFYLAGIQLDNQFFRKHLGIAGFLAFIIIENVNLEKKQYSNLIRISFGIIVLAFFVQILQQAISPSFLAKTSESTDLNSGIDGVRLESIYTWGERITYFGLSFFPVLAVLVDLEFKNSSKNAYLLLFYGFVCALLNKSRFILLNFFMVLVLIPMNVKINMKTVARLSLIVSLIIGGFLVAAPVIGFDTEKFVNERLLEKNRSFQSSGAGTRLLAVKIFDKLFYKNKVWGKGNLHSIRIKGQNESRDVELVRALHGRSSQIHVGYLSLFYYYGYVGGGIYMLFLILLTLSLYRDARETKVYGGLLGWSMFLISNLTLVFFDIFNMGILLVLIFNKAILNKLVDLHE
ncbi:hypothetical protein [Plebeiibacterium sediminum]|uniref:O-antigen ligase domain-containing protein n=1 Tax=Plebeiibacterium sediminum TaxID=2992112 RepID=A0AAE3M3M2_9BACT|nr:hypothetical protein [Plebeiobacterium sediminum]MCW3786249.1 hypothetical protein [Plebeiobacterium sediminum]